MGDDVDDGDAAQGETEQGLAEVKPGVQDEAVEAMDNPRSSLGQEAHVVNLWRQDFLEVQGVVPQSNKLRGG